LPFEKRYIDHVQKNGIPAMYHNCGQIMVLVDSYKELGAKIVEPFSPPPLGDCADLTATLRQIDGRYAVVGGIDQVNVLQKGSIDEIRRITEQTMNAVRSVGGAGFLFENVDFLEYGTPIENVEAFVNTAKQHCEL
jgi:uroporphyrinogen-III decarboxylase